MTTSHDSGRRCAPLLAAGVLLAGAAAQPAQDRRPDQDGRALRRRHHHRHGRRASSPRRSARRCSRRSIVDNRAGAGGSTGTDQVAKAAPDGRTLVMGTVGTHAINAALFRKLPYDPMRDFAPVAFVGYTPTLLVVAADSPVKSLKDLAALAARPRGRDLRLGRQRHLGPPRRRAARAAPRRQDDPRAVQGRRDGADGRDGGAGRLHVLSPGRGDAADQGRQAARARRERRGAQRRGDRRADADGAGHQPTSTWSPGSCSTRRPPRRRPRWRNCARPAPRRSRSPR